jgi:acyl-CoA dehydrogenase
LHAQDTAELIFEDAKVPAANLLGEEGKGFYYLMDKLQQERLLVAIGAQTSAERMLTIAKQYTKQRKAFGKSISDFQTVQFRLAEMATEIEIGRTFLDSVIIEHMSGKNAVTRVSMAKYWITDMAKKVASEVMQLHGGYGYMEEYEIARRYRDIPVSAIYAGTNEIMKTIIVKNLDLA